MTADRDSKHPGSVIPPCSAAWCSQRKGNGEQGLAGMAAESLLPLACSLLSAPRRETRLPCSAGKS